MSDAVSKGCEADGRNVDLGQRCILGATVFHAINARATEARAALGPGSLQERFGIRGLSGWHGDEVLRAEVARLGFEDVSVYSLMVWKDWEPGFALSACGFRVMGAAVTIAEALDRGLRPGRECMEWLGYVPVRRIAEPLLDSRLVNGTGRARAYAHAVSCEVCWGEGVGKCRVFPLLAFGEIVSDVDPRLEVLL